MMAYIVAPKREAQYILNSLTDAANINYKIIPINLQKKG